MIEYELQMMMLKRGSNFLNPPPPLPFIGPFTSCKQKYTSDHNPRLACIEMNSTFYKVPKVKKAMKFKKYF